ncbi:MAG: hypothetical protein GXP55_24575 [Deltaproteobacteria bacterium]|nr:hypothetical protein [Deltaproteobacteria bacterium]
MRPVFILLLVSLVALVACDNQEPASAASAEVQVENAPATAQPATAQPAAAPALAAAAPTTQQSPVLPANIVGATEAPPGAAPTAEPHAVVDPNAAGLAEVRETGEAIEAALNAAAEAGGDTPCERGYNNLVAMVRELRAHVGTSGQRNPPDREPFLEACNDLPPEVQECLVLPYALAHRMECQTRKDSLDPEVRARIRALMSGESAPGSEQ